MPNNHIDGRVRAIESLVGIFKLERNVYMGVTVLSLIMLLISAASLVLRNKAGIPELSLLFGSSGLITYSSGRLLHMWNDAIRLLLPMASKDS